jgi:transcriptional regulator with XRE-family HTH domain
MIPKEPMPCRLAELRRARGLSQERLSRAAGLSDAAVCRIEGRQGGVTLRTARAIARALGVSVDEVWPEGDGRHDAVAEVDAKLADWQRQEAIDARVRRSRLDQFSSATRVVRVRDARGAES